MGFFDSFPYSSQHTLNLDWLIKKQRELEEYVKQYTAVNNVKYSGIWDIRKQYPKWAIVTDGTKTYMSIEIVPSGVAITDSNYWMLLADLDPAISEIMEEIETLKTYKSGWESWGGKPIIRTTNRKADEGASYDYFQGGCCAGDYFVASYFDSNTETRKSNITKIVVFSSYTREIVKTALLEVGHCNDMTYNPVTNELVIAPGAFYVNGESVRSNRLIFVNFNTLEIVRTIDLTFSPSGIAFYDGGYLTIKPDESPKVFCKVAPDGTFERFASVNAELWPPVYQSLSTDGVNIYLGCAFPSQVYKMDFDGNHLETFSADGEKIHMPEGELEWCDFHNGDMFIGSAVGNFCGNYNYIAQYGSAVSPARLGAERGVTLNVTVDNANSSSVFPDIYNGGICREIDEACWLSHYDVGNVFIRVTNSGIRYAPVNIYFDFNGRIIGNGCDIDAFSSNVDIGLDNATVHSASIRSATFNFTNVKFEVETPCSCDRCMITLYNCTLTNAGGTLNTNNCVVYLLGNMVGNTPLLSDNSVYTSVFSRYLYSSQASYLPLPKDNSVQTYYDVNPVTFNADKSLTLAIDIARFNTYRSFVLIFGFGGKTYRDTIYFSDSAKTGHCEKIVRDDSGIYVVSFDMDLSAGIWNYTVYTLDNSDSGKTITTPRGFFSQNR